MGLLEMLFGKKGPEFTERIWMTTESKIHDLVAHVRNDQACGVSSVVVTHFKATHGAVLEALDKGGVSVQVVTHSTQFPSSILDVLRPGKSPLVLASDSIPSSVTRAARSNPKNTTLAPISVHLAEHYPCPGRDQQVLALDKALPMRIDFTCYTALDEPWLTAFGATRIRDLLPKLGMGEESVLEHPLLNRSLQAAQKRLAQQVPREALCESCEEWVRRNLHGG